MEELEVIFVSSNECLESNPCEINNEYVTVYCLPGDVDNYTISELWFNRLDAWKLIPALANLSNLTKIRGVSHGEYRFFGSIPRMPLQLQELTLLSNRLNGSLNILSNLGNLQILDVSLNDIEGIIPSQFNNLTKLQELSIYSNRISGTIPTQIGELTNLTNLNIGKNNLTGSIPRQLRNLTNLRSCDISHTNLDISNLFDISKNIEELFLDGMNISDITLFYDIVGNYTQLKKLYLSDNPLQGTIPSTIGLIFNLNTLNIKGTNLTGTFPIEMASLIELNEIIYDSDLLCPELTSEPKNSFFKGCAKNWTQQQGQLDGPVFFDIVKIETGNLMIGTNMNMITNTLILSQNSNIVLQNSTIKAINISISSLNLTISSNQNEPTISATECLNISPNSELNMTLTNTMLQQNQTIFSFKCKTGSFSKIRVNGNECNYELKNTYLSVLPNKDCEPNQPNQPNQPNSNTGEQKTIFSITLGALLSIFFIL